MLHTGLYEQVINTDIDNQLSTRGDAISAITTKIDSAEAPKILSQYIAAIIEKGLQNIKDKGGNVDSQIDLINKIIFLIKNCTKENNFVTLSVAERAEQLLSLFEIKNSSLAINENASIVRPETSLSQSSLFTGSLHEPQMYTELKKEIVHCNRIDMLVSFIKWSGLRLLLNELTTFTQNGGHLRVITTSYMGATDVKAIEHLSSLPNTEIKVSYDTKRTRLHAKAYVFYRDTGFTTSYVGSSNLSNPAISSGLEWNVKVTQADLPNTIDKIHATFESYWNSSEFEYYTETQKERLEHALNAERYTERNNPALYTIDITPYSYQQEILDQLEAERQVRYSFRNLVVAATGTGKTVVSAFDYKRFRKQNQGKPCRLLFVAHREEILMQSLSTFRAVLKDANFGDIFVGNHKPNSIDNLFISIQTFNAKEFTEKTTPDFYDYIIVDEFHHAAAPTYLKLLNYYQPKIFLGLTATPERMDGKSILSHFDNRIAAEIRLPEAIDRKLLCPFQYFGITDTVDLHTLKWTVGGYDKKELSNLYTTSDIPAQQRADLIVHSLLHYVTNIDSVKGLGFCASVEHAKYMSQYFSEHGIPAMYLTGESSDSERLNAKNCLVSGTVRVIFVVDIYNEGVDIPEVNTVLFLRPTESLTVFLQQLGRGLRLAEDKECLTVLDFIGQANKKYNFEEKFSALLSTTTRNVIQEVKDGFSSLPKGCYIQLERKAEKYILENIRSSYGNISGLISRISTFSEDTGLNLNLANFLEYFRIDARLIYKYSFFSRLCVRAKVIDNFSEPLEDKLTEGKLTKVFGKLASMNSRRFITFILRVLKNLNPVEIYQFSDLERRMFQMFYVTVWGVPIEDFACVDVQNNLDDLVHSPRIVSEMTELLQYNYNHIDFIDDPVDVGFACPLDGYCMYTRDQILVAMDFMKPSSIREGTIFLPEKKVDIHFITLNKSEKEYSPTTMYNDYSVNERLFHWQSQSTTSENSPTGQRYIHHAKENVNELLFVREFKKDRYGFTEAYVFLGIGRYREHSGSRPMNIIWELDRKIPAKFLKKTNKLVVV